MKYNNNTITISIAAYNVRKYICACIDSILNQSSQVDEFIIVDDGSTDETRIIIDEYAYKYQSIKVFHKENSGLCGVRKFTIEHATSDYILFFDGDDILAPDAIKNLREAINKYNSPDIIQGARIYFSGKKRWQAKYYKITSNTERLASPLRLPALLYTQSVGCKIIKRNLLSDLSLDGFEHIMLAEDHLITMHCYNKNPIIVNKK